jgi:hypothetical protein
MRSLYVFLSFCCVKFRQLCEDATRGTSKSDCFRDSCCNGGGLGTCVVGGGSGGLGDGGPRGSEQLRGRGDGNGAAEATSERPIREVLMSIRMWTECEAPIASRQYCGYIHVSGVIRVCNSGGRAARMCEACIGGAEHHPQNHLGVNTEVNALLSSHALTARRSLGTHSLDRALPPWRP